NGFYTASARMLLGQALPDVTALTAAERHLLAEWLDRIARGESVSRGSTGPVGDARDTL
ncbi:MAG: hypothetical protein H7Y15_14710, partial [Pseudonocardia sp.]|nr:hypothetical protein [Pseudonocardia sp.]